MSSPRLGQKIVAMASNKKTVAKHQWQGEKKAPGQYLSSIHAIEAALAPTNSRVLELWVAQQRQDKRITAIIGTAKARQIPVHMVDNAQIKTIANGKQQGCVVRCKPLQPHPESSLQQLISQLIDSSIVPLILILDSIQDPHNLGACLRTAEAAGVHAVIAPKDKATGLTETVIDIASGSAERVPFFAVTNLARVLRELKQNGIWLIGTSSHAESDIYQLSLDGPIAFILGAEGKGLRRLTQSHCDQLAMIPMAGEIESLNVSVAAGVGLFEIMRQRSLR